MVNRVELPELLTAIEACSAIGGSGKPICKRTLRRLVKNGHVIAVNVTPKLIRYRSDSIAAYLASVQSRTPIRAQQKAA